ncbi:MAG: gliding motility-associated protein GldE [Chitinophagaceae bacterium]|nr:gliding motility-associated protein GldE [Chitinophagaceae bacterium]
MFFKTKLSILDNAVSHFFLQSSFAPILLATGFQATATILALFVLLLLILSFFISGAQIAFFSLNYRDINTLKTKQDSGWKRIATLLEEPKLLQASLLVANALVNIAIIILSNLLIDQVLPLNNTSIKNPENVQLLKLAIKVPVITTAILLFGEVLPKIRAAHNNLRAAYEASYLVEAIFLLFKRVGAWLISISDRIEKFFGGAASRSLTQQQIEQEIRSTVHEEEEQRILAGIYKFRHIIVKQIMRTRLDVSGIEYALSFGQLKQRIEELHYSRLAVYRNSLDDVAGMIHTKDMLPYLNEPDDFDWHSVIRQPYFVHEQKYIEDLLKEFQTRRIHFAVVVDEFGGTSGIVTMEDILEEIVGDIRDEFDEDETGSKKLDDGTYQLEGKMMIHDACAMMGLQDDTFDEVKGDSDSIAGLMLEVAGEIPAIGDVLTVGDFVFTILEVDRNRIQRVNVAIQTQAN